jgi:hypothetical protein
MVDTFQKITFLNSVMAILSGVIASILVNQYGLIAPFLFASVLMLTAMIIIAVDWEECHSSSQTIDFTRVQNSLYGMGILIRW